jgi:tetratricopeptide (TPR) repeat protein
MHRRARRALADAQQSAGGLPSWLEALAYHCEGAGEYHEAARYAAEAGRKALGAYAMDLARGHFRRAMAALQRSGAAGREHDVWMCELACAYASACVFDPLALGNDISVFEDAVRRAALLGDAGLHAKTLLWLSYVLYGLGRYREALVHARAALALSGQHGDRAVTSQAEATLGEILIGTGEYEEAIRRIDAAVLQKRWLAREKAPGVPVGSAYALACQGSVFADRGEFARAHACFHEAIELLGRSMHPVGNSVRNWVSVAFLWQGDWQAAQRVAAESLRIAENTGALYLVAVARSTLGFARWCESGDAAGLRMLEDAVAWMEARGGRLFTSLHFGWLSEACAAEGRPLHARVLAGHVLQRARQGERLGLPIACRTLALMAAQQGTAAGAQRWLARADHAASARGSPRDLALNRLAAGRAAQLLGRPAEAGPLLEEASAALRRLGVTVPVKSLLRA